VKEDDHSCLVAFHLSDWPNKGFALAGGKGLKKDILSDTKY
jgi:hypothetical protein